MMTVFDWVQSVVGDVQNIQSRCQLLRPKIKVLDAYSGRSMKSIDSDVPDLIDMTGSLVESEHVAKDATFHMRFRKAQPFLGEPALIWTILGEKGEIRLTAGFDTMLQVSQLSDVKIEVHNHAEQDIERVAFKWEAYSELPHLARSYASLYEAYLTGAVGKYPDFDHALKRHIQLDGLLESWDAFRGGAKQNGTSNVPRSIHEEL